MWCVCICSHVQLRGLLVNIYERECASMRMVCIHVYSFTCVSGCVLMFACMSVCVFMLTCVNVMCVHVHICEYVCECMHAHM